MIGLCLGNGRKPTRKEKEESKQKKKSSPSFLAIKSQKAMDRVKSYFESIFQFEESPENAEEIESRRSQLFSSTLGQSKLKQQGKTQSVYMIPTPTTIGKESFISSDSMAETHVIWTEEDWQTILKVNDLEYTPHLDLCNSLRAGIPDDLRPRIWFFLSKVNELKKTLKSAKSNADVDINKDIPRTFPDNPFFHENKINQNKLFNILRAYANYDSILGYTQGMNYVVATMLLVLNPENYEDIQYSFGCKDFSGEDIEEKIFWMLIFVNYHKNWREVYRDGMVKTLELLKFFKRKMQEEIPEIYEQIRGQGLDLQMCFDHAFITILLYYTPVDFSKRILDIFFLKGEQIIFDILIRIMRYKQKDILEFDTTEGLFNYLRKDMIAKCFEDFRKEGQDYIRLLVPLPQVEHVKF